MRKSPYLNQVQDEYFFVNAADLIVYLFSSRVVERKKEQVVRVDVLDRERFVGCCKSVVNGLASRSFRPRSQDELRSDQNQESEGP